MATSFTQHISDNLDKLRRSERKVADYVLANATSVIQMRIVDLSTEAEVSEPTVVRFCRAIGCDGFQDFKLKLAQQLASSPTIGQIAVTDSDSSSAYTNKVFDTSIDVLIKVRDQINAAVIDEAVKLIFNARRVDFFGFGGSAPVAADAQHRLLRLGLATHTYSDPHIQTMAAMSLRSNDVVIAISQSGRTKALLDSLREVKRRGAKIISLSPSDTPVLSQGDVQIKIDVNDHFDVYSPLSSRIAHLVIIDAIAAGVAQHMGDGGKTHIAKLKQSLRGHRINYHEPSIPSN
ncbi:MurR/RpiR family transcriptional regulator [uncultured Umboniibacter sp.]|uniref:MurR/RpiR family transcriptional regulator n=1 Tax=uncultured Umboniibacter sp. TaxID=1798917 RepID=UPI0026189AB2|nr:MurR/RpiR family transcriptional regulator [uncultured Umboniibacter sp.]